MANPSRGGDAKPRDWARASQPGYRTREVQPCGQVLPSPRAFATPQTQGSRRFYRRDRGGAGLRRCDREGKAPVGADSVLAKGSRSAWIVVNGAASGARSSLVTDSHFETSGCGFRASSSDDFLVIYGPAPDTASLAYWVDPFPVGRESRGAATPSWTSSGIDGTFDVYVVRSASGNPWQAQPALYVVTIDIEN